MGDYRGQGRPPTPTALKQLRGTVRPDRVRSDEPQAPPIQKVPPCPTFLKDEARREWRRMARKLMAMGVLTAIDLDALSVYCQVYARWRDAEEKLNQFGPIIKDKDGGFAQSPYLGVANECIRQLRMFMGEFGITPSSRTRVSSTKPQDAEDPMERFIRGSQN